MGTSNKLFCRSILIYVLLGSKSNQMLTIVAAITSKTSCEPVLLFNAGFNDHLHAMSLLEVLKQVLIGVKKTWEAVQHYLLPCLRCRS